MTNFVKEIVVGPILKKKKTHHILAWYYWGASTRIQLLEQRFIFSSL